MDLAGRTRYVQRDWACRGPVPLSPGLTKRGPPVFRSQGAEAKNKLFQQFNNVPLRSIACKCRASSLAPGERTTVNTKIAESQHALVRWALRIREFQDRARQVSQGGAELQLWIVRPVKEAVVLAVLVVVTFLAGALRPKLLYAANGIGSIEHAKRPVFLNYRSFVLSVLALFQLFANQSIVGKLKEDQSELQLLPDLALEGLLLLMLFLIVALGALSVWVGARCSKARLSMSQSMKVSGLT